MSQITLDTILAEISRVRLETQEGFKEVYHQINGIHGEVGDLRGEVNGLRDEVRQIGHHLAVVEKDVRIIRNQTAHLTERVAVLESGNAPQSPSA
jgi:hypothetical protein